jgi:class 3 adenylate cyclase/tetratricopeptide (TPR) repeat protein
MTPKHPLIELGVETMDGNQSNNDGLNCPSCRHRNPREAKFCQQCGQQLHRICANCQTEIPPDAKFCHRCGQPTGISIARSRTSRAYTPRHLADKILTTRSALEGERKQVTVLFADIKGSMLLAEQVDPEDWHAILDDFFQILADGIHRFEGTINQYTGDGIMALFGAPVAHEDHAVRACYAALHLRRELRSHADQLRVKRGLNFGVRMGLNSGEVIVGRIGDDLRMDYTAQGQTVGLAARLEQLAESGCVYLSEHTQTLIEGFFKLRDLGLSSIKGVTQPVRIYELEEVREFRTRLDISQERGFSRFIGRNNEMAVLLANLERAAAGHGNVIGIVGEPGVGKSRLCYEFLEINRKRGITICEANCASHLKNVPLLPVLQLLRSFFGISSQEREEDARRKIAGTLILLDEAFKDTLPIWFDFLAVADRKQPPTRGNGEERQRKLFALIQRLVQTMSQKEPLIIVVEDLHWIDPSSDSFIDRLVEAVTDTRTLLLMNFRPEYRRQWMNRSTYRRLPLPALDTAASRDLLEDLLGTDSSLANLVPRIASRAQGNPYFIEELVRSLVDSGNLAGRHNAYRLVEPLKTQMLPRTVQAVLTARIDRLADSAKHVLQMASVIGQEFEAVILRRAVDLSAADLDACLYKLQEVEFFYQKAFYPVPMYAFKHPIMRDVAYHSLLTKQRTKLHRRLAWTIETTYPDRRDELAGLLAHHWEKAAKPLKAARRHRRAARASGFAEVQRTFLHWTQVLKLIKQVPAGEDSLRLQLEACCGALDIGGRVDISPRQVREIFEEGRKLAEKAGDFRSLLRLHEDMAARLGWSGDFTGQRRYLNEATGIAENVADPEIKLGLLQRRYVAEFHQGDLKSALAMSEEGIARCEASKFDLSAPVYNRLLRAFLLARANVLTLVGKLKEAESLIDQAAHLVPSDAKFKKDSRTTHTAALVRAHLSISVGDADDALRDARDFVALAERSGSTWAIAVSASTLGRACIAGERWFEARQALEYALAQARQHKLGLEAEASYLAFLAEALVGGGELRQALETAEEAVAVARRRGTHFWELQAQTALATVLLRQARSEDQDRIAETLDLADDLIEKTGGIIMKPFITIRRAEFGRLKGDNAGYHKMLQEAHRMFINMDASGHAARLEEKLRAKEKAMSAED